MSRMTFSIYEAVKIPLAYGLVGSLVSHSTNAGHSYTSRANHGLLLSGKVSPDARWTTMAHISVKAHQSPVPGSSYATCPFRSTAQSLPGATEP